MADLKTFIASIFPKDDPNAFKPWLCHGCQKNKKRHCSKFCQTCSITNNNNNNNNNKITTKAMEIYRGLIVK